MHFDIFEMGKIFGVEASACSKCHWMITCCSCRLPLLLSTIDAHMSSENKNRTTKKQNRTRIAQCQSRECDGSVVLSSTPTPVQTRTWTRISSHVFGALERLKRLTFLPCRMSTVHCPLPIAQCPLPAAWCPLSADLQVAAHASKLLEFLVSARINHTPWHLSKMLSVYGLGRPALIPMPIPAPVERTRPFCRLKVHLAIVCFVIYLASLVLQAPLRLVSVYQDTSEAPPLNSYSFNCYLSWVSAIRCRKVDAHNSRPRVCYFECCACACVCVWPAHPIWVMVTFMRILWTASTESFQIGILMAALLKTDTNRLSYGHQKTATDASDMVKTHIHCYYTLCWSSFMAD